MPSHLGALGRRRRRRRRRRPVEPRGRDLCGRALPRSLRRRDRHLACRLLLQPRPVVRRRGAPARRSSSAAAAADATFTSTGCRSRSTRLARRSSHANRQRLTRATRDRARSAARENRAARPRRRRRALLSDRLALEQRAVQLGVAGRRRTRSRQLPAGRARPGRSRTSPQARDRSLPASFTPAAGSLLAAPALRRPATSSRSAAAPRVVSVSHHHHDYPAADIAAPEGSPVYALATRSSSAPGPPRSGLRHRPDDRHRRRAGVDVLPPLLPRPGVTEGAQLAAGTAVGLVGHTGHATGPHLHLQLDPTTSTRRAALVPALRGHRLPLAGRRADRLDRRGSHAPALRRRPHPDEGIGCTGRPVHPVGGERAGNPLNRLLERRRGARCKRICKDHPAVGRCSSVALLLVGGEA